MKSLLLAIATVFILGGIVAITSNKRAYVGHPAALYKPASSDVLNREQTKVFGWISFGIGVCLGTAAIYFGRSLKVPEVR